MSRADTLHAGLAEITGRDPDSVQIETLLAYLDLLERWNRSYSLTAIRNPAEMITKHLLDSLSVLPWIDFETLLDAGSGAGLPGIPLAIARPSMSVTLLDSTGKKVRFLNHVRRELGLDNVFPVQERLESHSPDEKIHHGRYDGIISRAFADLAVFARAARPLASASTTLLAMKGRRPENELRDLPGWIRVDSVEKLTVPGLQEDRHLVIMSVIA